MSAAENTNGTIYELMPRLLAAVTAVGKEGWNKQQGYAFRSVDGIYAAVHNAEAEVGVFHLPKVLHRSVETLTTKAGGTQRLVTVEAEYHFYGPQGDSVVLGPVWGEGADSGDKATSKAQTAALKYGLIHALCIPLEGDVDADAHHVEFEAPEPEPPRDYAGVQEQQAKEMGWADLDEMGRMHADWIEALQDLDDEQRRKIKDAKLKYSVGWPMTRAERATMLGVLERVRHHPADEEQRKLKAAGQTWVDEKGGEHYPPPLPLDEPIQGVPIPDESRPF